MALLPKRLFFPSTVVKGWHHLWARWSKEAQERQFKGKDIMVQRLVRISSFMLKKAEKDPQKQSWALTTLFQIQWATRAAQSWPRKIVFTSHLMRWRYFILTHPPKCKITRTEFNWKWSGAFNITQTSINSFSVSLSFFLSFLFLLIEQN